MATEAQRLMMMSLGKIQGCRQQRGGINLYKSLLVTKVLYRARSVALTEHASPKKEVEEDQRVPEVVMQAEPEAHVVPSDDDHVADVEDDFYADDKENTKPVDNIKPHNTPVNTPEDFTDSKQPQPAPRCAKRRLTEVEEAVESISPKKQKVREEKDTVDYPKHEPMQVEQISSLVNRFSSGFTGLLATDSDSYEDNTEEEVQGHSESSLISCSTQIKESFELLARPIALSV